MTKKRKINPDSNFAQKCIEEYIARKNQSLTTCNGLNDYVVISIFESYKNLIKENLQSCYELVCSELKDGIIDGDPLEGLIDSVILYFHKSFRQTDIIPSLETKDGKICFDMLIWHSLQWNNNTFFDIIKNKIEDIHTRDFE